MLEYGEIVINKIRRLSTAENIARKKRKGSWECYRDSGGGGSGGVFKRTFPLYLVPFVMRFESLCLALHRRGE